MHTLDYTIYLIRLATGLTHLADNDVAIEAGVDDGGALDTDQAVLLGVVEPVARLASDNKAVDLVSLDPD